MRSLKLTFLLTFCLAVAPITVSKAVASDQKKKAYVIACGEVNKPGLIPFKEGMTVSHAVVLFEGMTANADFSRVMVLGHSRAITVDPAAVRGTNEDVELQAGDVIAVPARNRQQFFVIGEANLPGDFDFTEGMTLRQAAVLFKGPTPTASLARTIIVRGAEPGTRPTVILTNLGAVMQGTIEDVPILGGDIILIREFGVSTKP